MGQIGSLIADASAVGLRYAKRLIDATPAERFGRISTPGGQSVQSNHAAFAIGHLTLYPVKVLDLLGCDKKGAVPPENYTALFSKDAKCVDDADGKVYPPKDELSRVFQQTYDVALAALRSCDDQLLLAPNPVDSPMKTVCPTLGSMLAFYMTGHVMSHLGQVSAWRRMEGLPAA